MRFTNPAKFGEDLISSGAPHVVVKYTSRARAFYYYNLKNFLYKSS